MEHDTLPASRKIREHLADRLSQAVARELRPAAETDVEWVPASPLPDSPLPDDVTGEVDGQEPSPEDRVAHAPEDEASAAAMPADTQGEQPQTAMVDALMEDAVAARATDVHFDPHGHRYRVRFRVDGAVLDVAELEEGPGRKLLNQIRVLSGIDPVSAQQIRTGRFSYQLENDSELDLRVTDAPCLAGYKVAMRLLTPPRAESDIADLGMEGDALQCVRDWLNTVGGMLLVAGPTGSGKTTTAYALLNQLKLFDRHVVTLEDPVEYEIAGINQMSVNVARGLGFEEGAKGMMRLDPDYLLIGELRGTDSAHAAINVAGAGRALMSTLHSRDAVGAVTMLRNFGLDNFEIASNLEVVIAQRLVRRLCPECRTQGEPDGDDEHWLATLDLPRPDKVWKARGCHACNDLGFHGRVGVFEVWRLADEDYELILGNGSTRAIRRALAERGHAFLLDDALQKAEQGVTSLTELRNMDVLGTHSARRNARS